MAWTAARARATDFPLAGQAAMSIMWPRWAPVRSHSRSRFGSPMGMVGVVPWTSHSSNKSPKRSTTREPCTARLDST